MKFERPPEELPQNRTTEILGKQYEVVDVSVLDPDLIEQGDRAFITTKSGNRMMVRRSRSHGGALMIYSEREGFSVGRLLHNQHETIARVAEPMEYWVVTHEAKQLGAKTSSTEVVAIEIRKGVDDILNSTPDDLKAKSLADRLRDETTGKK